jgi:serine/threonine protein phosphatase PrpC
MTLRLTVGAATDVGRVRDHNEDGYLIDDDLRLVAVADGMGGHRGGEVASAIALEVLLAEFADRHDLRDAVVAANDAVYERSIEDDAVRGMGTTLTVAVLGDDHETLILGHVGDSRAYLFRGGALRRVTTDHSLVEELTLAGELTEDEAFSDPRRSQITRAVGLEPGVEVDLYPVALAVGDRVLLCSDGLTDMVRDDLIAELLAAEPDPERVAQQLVDAANDAGGTDNTTVVIVDVIVDVTDGGATGDAVPTTDDDDDEDPDDDAEAPRGRRRFGIFGRRR